MKVPDLGREAPMRVVAGVFPDRSFGGDCIGERFAYYGAPREGGDVGVCKKPEDLEEKFVGEVGEEGKAPCRLFRFFGGGSGGREFRLFQGF